MQAILSAAQGLNFINYQFQKVVSAEENIHFKETALLTLRVQLEAVCNAVTCTSWVGGSFICITTAVVIVLLFFSLNVQKWKKYQQEN